MHQLFDGSDAETLPSITEKERDVLTHALTGSNGKRVYRNYYAISSQHHAEQEVKSLVAKGFMKAGRTMHGSTRYHCTTAGAEAVGLSLPEE